MYSMSSPPLMDSSSGEATVSAMTLGLAPGYWARTTTDGGTTSGYSAMGSWNMASRPASSTTTDSTPAKIGRSMKNREIFMGIPPCSAQRRRRGLDRARRRVHGNLAGRDHIARPHALHAVDDDALARPQAVLDHAQRPDVGAQRHLAVGSAVAVFQHQHE